MTQRFADADFCFSYPFNLRHLRIHLFMIPLADLDLVDRKHSLTGPEDLAQQTLHHERPDPHPLPFELRMQLLDEEFVRGLHVAAGGVTEKLADQVPGKKVFAGFSDDLFEAGEVLVRFP